MDLSNEIDDDDDTHICLRCHTTMVGLDVYVAHRKANQCKRETSLHAGEKTDLQLETIPDTAEYPLRADDFFSSLELQSSAKTPSSRPSAGILTRSKANAAILASGHASHTREVNEKEGSWIGGHSLKVSGTDNHSKLIKAVDNISGCNVQKKDESASRYQYDLLNEYKGGDVSNDDFDDEDEDSEEEDDGNAPPRTHTGGKWKPRASPVQWMQTGEERSDWHNSPPPTHTGGKWKPSLPSGNAPSTSSMYRDEHSEDEDMQSVPPPNYTKGKWIPGRQNEAHRKLIRSESKHINPPNNYTRGKWIPEQSETRKSTHTEMSLLRKSAGTVQYWCGPCNRTLASKIVYDRHVKSELHKKRTYQEAEYERSHELDEIAPPMKTLKKDSVAFDAIWKTKKSTKSGQRSKRRCGVCRIKVVSHLIGKHLISHYHYHKSKQFQALSEQMVLDNIHSIVVHSPFQCQPCRFFCNTHTTFLEHWTSSLHAKTVEASIGDFWCTFCEFHCKFTFEMGDHLRGETHAGVVSAINRSVPIIIYRRCSVFCKTCGASFRYNVQLKRHCMRLGHSAAATSASDAYQQKCTCNECGASFHSAITYQRHLKRAHKIAIFVCSLCTVQFNTMEEVRQHRNTSEHKRLRALRGNANPQSDAALQRRCSFCPEKFSSILSLKTHLHQMHAQLLPRCPQCGVQFALPQQVASHLRSNSCAFYTSFAGAGKMATGFQCKLCAFRTESEAEFMFHEALHGGPESAGGTAVKKYKCPVCGKTFRRASFRAHLRLHTAERPYVCDVCAAGFVRKHNLVEHKKNMHSTPDKPAAIVEQQPNFVCPTCGKSFAKRLALQHHKGTHHKSVQCPEQGCTYLSRSQADLQPHLKTHGEERSFACSVCNYTAKTQNLLYRHMKIHDESKQHQCPHCPFASSLSFHLRRHMRLHTGAKPFMCPHCDYVSNGLENLRKHVISTKKHPGKCLYECRLCGTSTDDNTQPFACNFAKEFRVHLLSQHSEQFGSNKEAATYIAGIYDAQSDPKQTHHPLPITPKNKLYRDKSKGAKRLKSESVKYFDIDPEPSTSTAPGNASTTSEPLSPAIYRHSPILSATAAETKDDATYITLPANETHGWPIGVCYGVEESGTLVPFDTEQDTVLIQVD